MIPGSALMGLSRRSRALICLSQQRRIRRSGRVGDRSGGTCRASVRVGHGAARFRLSASVSMVMSIGESIGVVVGRVRSVGRYGREKRLCGQRRGFKRSARRNRTTGIGRSFTRSFPLRLIR